MIEDDQGGNDGDDAQTRASVALPAKKTPTASIPFDDGSEPDFAGWLAAQAQKKSGVAKVLPKGLGKSTSTPTGKTAVPKAQVKAQPAAAKKVDLKPKETDEDDGWGDSW